MNPLIILSGPTAVGKTELSINLATQVGGEIISADSMQVYKGMDIGSAKITPSEMSGIPHHLIDILEPEEEFNVADFKNKAQKAVSIVTSNGHIPIVTGGTGFYIQALLYDIDFSTSEGSVSVIRERLYRDLNGKGAAYLFEKLTKIDPEYAGIIHPNNTKRVIRAIEYYEETGERYSVYNEREKGRTSPFNFAYFVLTLPREELYKNIDTRVDQMIDKGLLEEVQKLRTRGLSRKNISMLGLGYKEILDYLDNIITLDEAIYTIKRDTRHFAKRQLTWFRREKDVIFIDKSLYKSNDEILDYMISVCKDRNIIK